MRHRILLIFISFFFTACGQIDNKTKQPKSNLQPIKQKTSGDDIIEPETDLEVNHRHYSPDNQYFAIFQSDGNFVLYRASDEKSIWSSHTNGTGANRCRFQNDGTIVIYKDVHPLAVFGRKPPSGMNTWFLKVQENGEIVIYADYNKPCLWVPIWTSAHLVYTDTEISNYIANHPCITPPSSPNGGGGNNGGGGVSGLHTRVVLREGCKYGQKAVITNSDRSHPYFSTLKITVESNGTVRYEPHRVEAGGEYEIGCTSLDGIHFNRYEVVGETRQ